MPNSQVCYSQSLSSPQRTVLQGIEVDTFGWDDYAVMKQAHGDRCSHRVGEVNEDMVENETRPDTCVRFNQAAVNQPRS